MLEAAPILRQALVDVFAGDDRFHVLEATSDNSLPSSDRVRSADVVLLCASTLHGDSIATLARLIGQHPEVRVLVFSSFERGDHVRRAICAGAFGYVLKHSSIEQLLDAAERVAQGIHVLDPSLQQHLVEVACRTVKPDPTPQFDELRLRVLRRVAQGATDHELAMELMVCTRTVQNLLRSIRRATGSRSRVDLTRWIIEHDLD